MCSLSRYRHRNLNRDSIAEELPGDLLKVAPKMARDPLGLEEGLRRDSHTLRTALNPRARFEPYSIAVGANVDSECLLERAKFAGRLQIRLLVHFNCSRRYAAGSITAHS